MKTRFAPSPTGRIHLGNARTALFSALLGANGHGNFLLRIEDTDLARSKTEHTHALIEDLHWLGVHWQEGAEVGGEHVPYYQAQRMNVYDDYYNQLIKTGRAFWCYKTDVELDTMRKVQRASGKPPRYPKNWREQSESEIAEKKAQGVQPALRFKVDDGAEIKFIDGLKGEQKFFADDIGDFVIKKADGSPSFMFCNAVDDALMGVTHVVRGEDHLTNTPRQLMILDALSLRKPEYIHASTILGSDGKPLSKRNGSRSVQDLREMGFLSVAVMNYMARLGHYYRDNNLMDFTGLAEQFTIDGLVKSAAQYDENQLIFWQKEALAQTDEAALWQWMGESVHQRVPADQKALFIETIRENIIFPQDALAWAELLFGDQFNLSQEQQKIVAQMPVEAVDDAIQICQVQGPDLTAVTDQLKLAHNLKGKSLFQPLRMVLTGQLHGPKMGPIMQLLGQERCIKRLEQAKTFI